MDMGCVLVRLAEEGCKEHADFPALYRAELVKCTLRKQDRMKPSPLFSQSLSHLLHGENISPP